MKSNSILRRFNLLDAAVVLVIIAAIAAIAFRMMPDMQKIADGGDEKYVLTIVINNIRQVSVDALKKDQIFYDYSDVNNPKILGKKINVEVEPYEQHIFKTDGSVVLAEMPDRYKVNLQIEVTGKMLSDGFYTKERTSLTPLGGISITSKYVTTSGQILSIEKAES